MDLGSKIPNDIASPGLIRAFQSIGITDAQIAAAVQTAADTKLPSALAKILKIEESQLYSFLSAKTGLEVVSANALSLMSDPELESVAQKMAKDYAMKHCCFPARKRGDDIVFAFADPFNFEIIKELEFLTGARVVPAFAVEAEIKSAIRQFYGSREEQSRRLAELSQNSQAELPSSSSAKPSEEDRTLEISSAKEPIVQLVNKILSDGITQGASDIHLEPTEKGLDVRFRVDGVMNTATTLPKRLQSYVITRIKVIAALNIAEKRRPQDGRYRVVAQDGSKVDVRVSVVPTPHGEAVAMRLLSADSEEISFESIGMLPAEQQILREALKARDKLIIVSGPTGSGKSTTLYAAICQVKTGKQNIVTVENPIEYRIEGATQIEVDPKIGVTFASGLRSILRQDPDIILVGEVRDSETAEISFQAAQTGHLVLTTLHTNDAPSCVLRLEDLGIDSYLIASSVGVIVAQRLVRKLCTNCRRRLTAEEAFEVFSNYGVNASNFWTSKGCDVCAQAGYNGRVGIFSILHMNKAVRDLVRKGASEEEISEVGRQHGMKTLFEAGMELVHLGVISIFELERVVGRLEEIQQPKMQAARPAQKPKPEAQSFVPSESLFQPPSPSYHPNKAIRVLLVDDEESVRFIMSKRLRKEGFEVVTANDGDDALKKLISGPPDVIVLDLMMPQMDGKRFTELLRQDSRTKNIPILLLTNAPTEQNEIDLLEAGVSDFVAKTSSLKVVVARIRRLLERS